MNRKTIALEAREANSGRLFSPSAGRNQVDIAAVLAEVLPKDARVLEVASGTGEHGIATLRRRPDLHWQFSDPDAESRKSQAAWIASENLELPDPIELDVRVVPNLGPFDAIFCANMIHIAPIEALQGLVTLGEHVLASGSTVWLYGPFLFGGDSAPSNLDFDASLKSRNPAWGVRESDYVKHIFALHGFNQTEQRPMPKNNHFFGFKRR